MTIVCKLHVTDSANHVQVGEGLHAQRTWDTHLRQTSPEVT